MMGYLRLMSPFLSLSILSLASSSHFSLGTSSFKSGFLKSKSTPSSQVLAIDRVSHPEIISQQIFTHYFMGCWFFLHSYSHLVGYECHLPESPSHHPNSHKVSDKLEWGSEGLWLSKQEMNNRCIACKRSMTNDCII